VPPWLELDRDEPECDFLPPRLDAPGELAIRAARSFDMPFSFSFSYCFSFFTLGLLLGMIPSFPKLVPCSLSPAPTAQTPHVPRYPPAMDPTEDSWESLGWEGAERQAEPDREQLLSLARRLAEQRDRQRSEDLSELQGMKRALRDRAADVARRELEVERRERELESARTRSNAGRRALRIRRPEQPPPDADRAYADELLSRREKELQDRLTAVVPRERDVIERETALRARELKIEEALVALAAREHYLAERESSLEQHRQVLERSLARLEEDRASLEERERATAAYEAEAERAREEVSRLTDELVRRTATLEAAERQLAGQRERLTDRTPDFDEDVEVETSDKLPTTDEHDRELAARASALDERELDLAARASALDERRGSLEQDERQLEETLRQLGRRETEVGAREAEVLRLQAGLATQQESLRARERALEDAERMHDRERARPAVPYVSFAEGLDALSATRRRD
jgi:hypothetical protein